MAYSDQEKRNLALVAAMYDAVLKPMESSQVDRFVAPGYVQHSPLAASGPEPLKRFLDHIRQESPDAVHDVKRMFADGDHVIVHTHVRRHEHDSGLAVVDIFRVENNMLVEHWDVIQEIGPDIADPDAMF